MRIIGVDEVGRGCWAGPVVAAAALFDYNPKARKSYLLSKLRDSKLLSAKQRQVFSELILAQAIDYGIGWVSVSEIDEIGLTAAVRLAMERAVAKVNAEYDELIIDGNYNFFPDNPKAKAIIKADGSVPAVSAASIIAKVARDKWMAEEAHGKFPRYRFDLHVGYGTAKHRDALLANGVCELHRTSFKPIKALLEICL